MKCLSSEFSSGSEEKTPGPRVYVCGEALIDCVPCRVFSESPGVDGQQGSDEGFLPKPGGSPLNTSKASARAGARVHFIGALSSDLFGQRLLIDLHRNHVDTSLCERSTRFTTLAFVEFSGDGPRYAFFHEGSANVHLTPNSPPADSPKGSILAVGSVALIEKPAADRIANLVQQSHQHLTIALDPNVRSDMIGHRDEFLLRMRQVIDVSAIIKLSTEDLAVIAPQTTPENYARACLARGTRLMVISDGENGCTAFTDRERLRMPIPQGMIADSGDTIGAGDTLNGALLAWLTSHGLSGGCELETLTLSQLHAMLTFAMTAAAINCARVGCDPPWRSEILRHMERITELGAC